MALLPAGRQPISKLACLQPSLPLIRRYSHGMVTHMSYHTAFSHPRPSSQLLLSHQLPSKMPQVPQEAAAPAGTAHGPRWATPGRPPGCTGCAGSSGGTRCPQPAPGS